MKRINKRLVKLLLAGVCAVFVGGCARCCESYRVGVDAVSSDAAMVGKDYVLVPGAEGVHEHDLKFGEYGEYVHRGLQGKGFNGVDREDADVIIFMSYGVREPISHYYIETHPAVSRTDWNRHYYGPYGWETRFDSYTTYTRYLIIGGYEAERFRESEGKDLVELWKTTVESTGLSSDLKRVMPVLAAAACEYAGKDTGGKINITIREGDRKVKFIKGEE